MHICFTGQYPLNNLSAGGVGTFTQTLAEALVKQGIRVTVIASYPGIDETDEVQNGVHIYWLNQNKWSFANFIRNAYKINQYIKSIHLKDPIDIVETQENGLAFIDRLPGAKYLIRLHGGHYFFSRTLGKPFSRLKGSLEKRSFPKSDACIAVSRFVLEETAKYIDIDYNKAVVIPNPVDITRFHSPKIEKAISHRIFFTGRLVEKKGIRQLIAAMPIVLKQYPHASLDIIGGDTIIDYGSSFKEILIRTIPPSIQDSIAFKGEIKNEDLPAMMETAEICVYPSHMEAMPIAWLEVMAMGKPFVASNIGPAKELINDGEDALLCDPHSPNDIAEKIMWMFEHKEKALEMGRKARAKVLQHYALDIVCKKNIDFFEKLSTSKS
jgi:glycosyltransferase involved in cell wall biosynthesis